MIRNKLKRTREGFTRENHDVTARHRETNKEEKEKSCNSQHVGKTLLTRWCAYLAAQTLVLLKLMFVVQRGTAVPSLPLPAPPNLDPELAQATLRHPPPSARAWCWRTDLASVSDGRDARPI